MSNKNITPYIIIISLLFILSSLIGYMMPLKIQQEVTKDLDKVLSFAKDLSQIMLLIFILLNNSVKALIAMLLGVFFGIVPAIFMIFNGYIIGLMISYLSLGMSFGSITSRLIPHGIFEIPAFIIASGYGLWLGMKFYRKLRYKEPLKDSLIFALQKYFKIVLPLLLIAAFIEVFITHIFAL
jgi:stage II sporulation protein M